LSDPRLRRSVVIVAVVAAVWGAALPALLRCGPVARHVEAMEEKGVNPAAMYYTVRPDWIERRLVIWP
jgi:hypothetical protein